MSPRFKVHGWISTRHTHAYEGVEEKGRGKQSWQLFGSLYEHGAYKRVVRDAGVLLGWRICMFLVHRTIPFSVG